MYELALFAGAGGGILGGKLLGWTCVGAVEIERYPRRVLLARQRDGILPWFPIWDDIRTFRSDNPSCSEYLQWLRSIRSRLVVSGGFPCQKFSTAARGRNNAIDLWPEMFRVIDEIRPSQAFGENVKKSVIERSCSDLKPLGYTSKAIPLERKTWALTIHGNDFGFVHTPTTKANYAAKTMQKWPCARAFVQAFGKPQPWSHEYLMGWPIGWTSLDALEMDRFQSWLQQHGQSSINDLRPEVYR